MTKTNDTTPSDPTTSASVIPVLVYEDIEAGHDYLVGTFGFTSGGIHRTDDGTVVHAEVRMGDAAVWLHQVTEEHEMVSPKDSATATGGLEVIVPDVDAHYARSVAAGATYRSAAGRPGLRVARVRHPGPREPPLVVQHAPRLRRRPELSGGRRRGAGSGVRAGSGGPGGPPGSPPPSPHRVRWPRARRGRPWR